MRMNRRILVTGLIAGIVAVTFVLFSAVTVISPEDMTRTRLMVLEYRIRQYMKHNKPETAIDLHSLPISPGRDHSVVDGWRRLFLCTVEGPVVTLTSYGKDGVPGGLGKNADISYRFDLGTNEQTRSIPGPETTLPQATNAPAKRYDTGCSRRCRDLRRHQNQVAGHAGVVGLAVTLPVSALGEGHRGRIWTIDK